MAKAHVPTTETRKLVNAMAGVGIPQDDIAAILDISRKTLTKCYPKEIKLGMIRADAAVGGALYSAATAPAGTSGQVAASIFWMKVRKGWKEPAQAVAVSNPDGTPLEIRSITRVIIDPSNPAKAADQGSGQTAGKAKREKAASTATVREGLKKSAGAGKL